MKKLSALLLLTFFCLKPAIEEHMPILAITKPEGARSPQTTLVPVGAFLESNIRQPVYISTFCDVGGWFAKPCESNDWCIKPVSDISNEFLNNFFIIVVMNLNTREKEPLIVTGDQFFITKYGEEWCGVWKSTLAMFIDMQRYPDKPIYIARWPKYIEDTTDPNDWIMGKVEAIIHVLPEHGKTMRFYKFSVEKAHTFLVGNDHWIAHNWAGPTFQAVAEWGMDFAMHGIRSTAEQGAMPGWCPSRIHGRAGDAYWQIEIEEKFKAAQRQYNREEAQRMAGNTAAFAGGNPPPQATPPTPPPPQNPKNGTDPEKNKYEGMKDSSVQKGTRSYDNRVDEHIKKLGQEIRDKPWISYASSLGITSEKVIDNIKNGRIGHLVDEIVAFCQNRQELIDEATRRGINPR